ncbi:hypothetical protein AMR72_16285 [Flavobacterium psychrophilum]|nr:hypothetical protein AMR72_16285 [Flavobacterium psychrophilum]AOE53923.1 hypothetical protein ALW18_16275 [Flavobacterium psychrophilum]
MKLSKENWRALTLVAMCLLSLLALVIGCAKPPLPPAKESSQETNNTTVNHTDKTEIDRNKAVNDSLKIVIGDIRTGLAVCDSLCELELSRVLQQLNHAKTSGDNSYGILYDKYKKQLTMYANLAETVNTLSKSTKDSIVYKDKLFTKEIPVVVKYTPWYYEYPAYFSWASLLLFIAYALYKIRLWTKTKLQS